MSSSNNDQDRIINVEGSSNPVFAVVDAKVRSQQAAERNPAFFNSRQHQAKIAAVCDIVEGFFKIKKGVYVNHRENRGKPFTTVKVDNPAFPNVSRAKKQSSYLDPLRALGVEIVFSARTNSYIFHVR